MCEEEFVGAPVPGCVRWWLFALLRTIICAGKGVEVHSSWCFHSEESTRISNMLQADFRGANGPKRARTDDSGARGEGDWTCPSCGNVNFAFRTTCNMRKCATPKPVDGGQRGIGGPLGPAVYDQPPAPMYMGGPGAPSPLSLGLPTSYGAPMIMPQQPTVTVPYDYGASMNNPQSYQQISRPTSYPPPGAVIGGVQFAGPAYGAQPVMDAYGMNLGMNMGPPPMDSMQIPAPRAAGNYGDENGSRKRRGGPDGFSEGDWICPKCGNTNFAFRTTCNMRKCGATKPTENNRFNNGPPPRAPPVTQGPPPDGSWTCEACGNVNYPFRVKCNRRNCGADKPTESKAPPVANSSPPPTDQ